MGESFAWIERDPTVYHTMNGPSEFHVVGSIKDWQSNDRLPEIALPTLLVSGRYDEATPALQETLRDGIRGAEWVVFESHPTCRTSRSASGTCRSSATGSRATTDRQGVAASRWGGRCAKPGPVTARVLAPVSSVPQRSQTSARPGLPPQPTCSMSQGAPPCSG